MIPLDKRILLEDGRSVVEPSQVAQYLAKGLTPADLLVTELTADIKRFNQASLVKIHEFIDEPLPPALEWRIPDEYKYLDIEQHLLKLAEEKIVDRHDERYVRIAEELALFESHGMVPLLRALLFIIDRMKAENVVWGVGRGSSTSSYLLYLIGLHNVDPVKYEIDIKDFIRDD